MVEISRKSKAKKNKTRTATDSAIINVGFLFIERKLLYFTLQGKR